MEQSLTYGSEIRNSRQIDRQITVVEIKLSSDPLHKRKTNCNLYKTSNQNFKLPNGNMRPEYFKVNKKYMQTL